MSKLKMKKPKPQPTCVTVEATKSSLVKDAKGTTYLLLAGTIGTLTKVSSEIGGWDIGPGWVSVKWRALLAHGKRATVVRSQPEVRMCAAHMKVLSFHD